MYQISVSIGGRFLFRTDWFQQRDEAKNALYHIRTGLDAKYKVTLAYKKNLQVSNEITKDEGKINTIFNNIEKALN